MEPIERGKLREVIYKAVVEFLDTGEEFTLEERADSACHFFQRFTVDDDEVQLRIDWSDIGDDNNPVLDADFYCSKTGKKRSLKGSRLESHHTTATPEQGRQYVWSYRNYKRPFKVKVMWLISGTAKVTVRSELSCIVRRVCKQCSQRFEVAENESICPACANT